MLDTYSDVLTITDICDILHISRKTVMHLIHSGQLPCRRIGRIYRISRPALLTYLAVTQNPRLAVGDIANRETNPTGTTDTTSSHIIDMI